MNRFGLRHVTAVACLVLTNPGLMAAESQPDTVRLHSLSAGPELGKLLSDLASITKGAFTTAEAARIHRAVTDSMVAPESSPLGQIKRRWAYLVRPYEEHQAVLMLDFLSTRSRLVDLMLVSDPVVMRLIRTYLDTLEIDSLLPLEQVRLTLTEERRPGLDPRPILTVSTVRQFDCLGLHIDHDLHPGERDTVYLNLHGVTPEHNPCAARGPALTTRAFPPGALFGWRKKSTLLVTYRNRRDSLEVEMSDTTMKLTPLSSSLVTADARPRWRYPRNSFAFYCSTRAEGAHGVCRDVDSWLTREPGISRLPIPSGWLNPYDPDPSENPDRIAAVFRYAGDQTYERLRLCFGAIENQIRDVTGLLLFLEDWHGTRIVAVSRGATEGRQVQLPKRITATNACRTPRWVDQSRAPS
jgi:hypothetical protein